MHAGHRQGDGSEFILHPLEVATLLADAGAPEHVIAAGALHDVLEDTDATVPDLNRRFGPRVTDLVLAVSDDARIGGFANRKAALRRQVAAAGEEALTLFAADKISRLRELRRENTTQADSGEGQRGDTGRRLGHYRASLRLLERRIPQSPLLPKLRAELRNQTWPRPARPALPSVAH